MTNKETKTKVCISINKDTLDKIKEVLWVVNTKEHDDRKKLTSLSVLIEQLILSGYETDKEGLYYEAV